MQNLALILAVGAGGMLGAITRFLLSESMNRMLPRVWIPAGTLAVNLVGCLLIGYCLERWLSASPEPSLRLRLFVTVGFLGGLTTFSTFAFETYEYLAQSSYWQAGLNVLVQVLFGLGAVALGIRLAQTGAAS